MLSDIYWIKLIISNNFHFLCTLWSITSDNKYWYWQGNDLSFCFEITYILNLPLNTPLAPLLFHVVDHDKADFPAPLVAFRTYQVYNRIIPGRKGRSAYVGDSTSSGNHYGRSVRNWFIRPACLLSRWRRSPFRWLLLRGKATNLWALCPA